jgi:D-psicose/D-tagatose/L-ribulose 3-epimerase
MTPHSLGIHGLVWVGSWSEANARYAMAGAREAGFDRIEIPLLDDWEIDPGLTRGLLEEYDLGMTGNQYLTAETDITSEDPEVVSAGEQRLIDAVDLVRDVGGGYLCGTIYSKLGKYESPPSPGGWRHCAGALRRVADHASESGITLGLELCNRFETNLLNTANQALAMIDDIDRPNVCVHLDTYHMNIEETDMVSPVLACGDRLGYVHICESHRGYLGSGNVDFGSFFRALSVTGYDGPIVFESFSSAVAAPALSNALCIWRDLWTDSEDLATHAHQFIQSQLHAVAASKAPSAHPKEVDHAHSAPR